MEIPLEISPQEVARRRAAGEALSLIDVREAQEFSTARIEGSELIPMNSVPAAIGKLEAQADKSLLVTVCHHGVRSLNVAVWLRNQGVSNCSSMAGGIDRWSIEVDPSVPRY
jgi:rhodanese-related sulfurtransferase